LRLNLALSLLLVVHTSLYRCVQTGIWVERGGAVDFASAFNVEVWNIIRDRNDQLRSEN
jgi:hypothetical protein